MKYLKKYENYLMNKSSYDIEYGYGRDLFFLTNVLDYLGTYFDIKYFPANHYNIDAIKFIKEILLDKRILFTSVDATKNNPTINGIVRKVIEFYLYKMDYYLKVDVEVNKGDDKIVVDTYLINPEKIISIYDYDADKKPLHKEMKMKKEAEKYNL